MTSDPSLTRLSDADLQERIDRFSRAMLAAQARYQVSKAIDDRAARDNAWLAMKQHLQERGRRRRIVDRMEDQLQRLHEENKALWRRVGGGP